MFYQIKNKINEIERLFPENTEIDSLYADQVNSLTLTHGFAPVMGDVFLAMLKLILSQKLVGACHPTTSILYVIYNELGFDVDLNMGEVKIDHRYFDHSWIEVNSFKIDASLINPINKTLGLSPVYLNLDLDILTTTSLQYGVCSDLGISEFTEIISRRPFNKYMNPFPWGKGKWHYVEAINNYLNLNIDVHLLPGKYTHFKRNLIRK